MSSDLRNPDTTDSSSSTPPMAQSDAAAEGKGRHTEMRDDAGALRGKPFPVVGIGASAGGLEALTSLLRELPSNTGMAFVIVQHLDPNHETQLPELLARTTEMPVFPVHDGEEPEPDRVYINPPNADVTLKDGKLRLSARKPGVHMPIDSFFTSLAVAQGSRAIGVVLSGNASDGSQGLRMIKGEYGITFAQDEVSARYASMPRNAVATGAVDFVMSPPEIARELVRVSAHPYVNISPEEPGCRDGNLPEGEDELQRIFRNLQAATKVDFTHYKRNTIRRRIGRRMIVHRKNSLAEYAKFLEDHAGEARELYLDLLINVTNFFRDPDAFMALTKVVMDSLPLRKSREPLRIWIPGCATGEEVYSVAICLTEALEDLKSDISLQLFGTDINEAALEKCRAGVYADDIRIEVSQERLQRFFIKADRGYQINRVLRDSCVFARQDITRDPPFAHTDLITCRNVLIYMDAALQRRVLPVFHYSLCPTGILMLGSAETVGAAPELFEVIDKQHRIYGRRAVPVRLTLDLSLGRDPREFQPPLPITQTLNGPELIKKVDRIIQSKYSPAAVVVDSDLKILHFRGNISFYFDPAPGDATLNLLRMVRENLVVPLRRNIEAAKKKGVFVRESGVVVEHRGEHRSIALEVTPIPGVAPGEQYFLLVFEEASAPAPAIVGTDGDRVTSATDSERPGVDIENHRRQLQQQLSETREYLRNLNEDHEAGMEELRAANEEVRSANEELQSTNEELSTTKEELQSANEELTTVNEELQNRNNELDILNNDLGNLLTAVNIPIIMVDGALRVRRFNPVAEKLLELTPADMGRPISHVRGNIEVPQLENMLRTVLETLVMQNEEAQDKSGHWYNLIARPYRTTQNRIDGAVIVFIDIDPLKRSLASAEEARDFAEGMIETVREPLIVLDQDLRVQRATSSFFDLFHVTREETLGRFLYDLGNGQWNRPRLREMLGDALFRNQPFHDLEIEHEFPHIGRRTVRLNARRISRQEDRSRVVLLSIEDITVLREQAEIRYQRLFESAKDAILVLDNETRLITDVNPYLLEMTGLAREDLIGKKLGDVPLFNKAGISALTEDHWENETIRLPRVTIVSRSGQVIETEVIANRYTIGAQVAVQLNIRDVTDRLRAERARTDAEEALKAANSRLYRANSDLEQFAYAASHDIQEPLRTITIYSELFQKTYGDQQPPEAKKFLDYIFESGRRLQSLVSDLLSYTRNTAHFEPPTTTIDSRVAFEAALDNLRTPINESNALMTAGALPKVRMHQSHLLQLFQNLIGNAIKYRKEEQPRVEVTSEEHEHEWVFHVTDNGVGVEPGSATAIFGLFERFRGRERPGTGIGLAICAKIIENYRGRIWVESVPGQGSRFSFTVPKGS